MYKSNKALYESIMQKVSKVVKKQLNEYTVVDIPRSFADRAIDIAKKTYYDDTLYLNSENPKPIISLMQDYINQATPELVKLICLALVPISVYNGELGLQELCKVLAETETDIDKQRLLQDISNDIEI